MSTRLVIKNHDILALVVFGVSCTRTPSTQHEHQHLQQEMQKCKQTQRLRGQQGSEGMEPQVPVARAVAFDAARCEWGGVVRQQLIRERNMCLRHVRTFFIEDGKHLLHYLHRHLVLNHCGKR